MLSVCTINLCSTNISTSSSICTQSWMEIKNVIRKSFDEFCTHPNIGSSSISPINEPNILVIILMQAELAWEYGSFSPFVVVCLFICDVVRTKCHQKKQRERGRGREKKWRLLNLCSLFWQVKKISIKHTALFVIYVNLSKCHFEVLFDF